MFFLVVVDLTERSTIELAGTWRQELLSYASADTLSDNPGELPILLLGNKHDLVSIRVLWRNQTSIYCKVDDKHKNINIMCLYVLKYTRYGLTFNNYV